LTHHISLLNLIPNATAWQRPVFKAIDHVLGIAKMNRLYHTHHMQGLSKEAFADKILDIQAITLENTESLLAAIPDEGPVVLASNHPFGGIEGVILARLISQKRPDLKVFANKGLKVFKELEDFFIFTNPLAPNDPKNAPSIRQAMRHVKAGNALLIFPAGRVSYYQEQYDSIAEHEWNKLVYVLTQQANALLLPIFVQGQNRPIFYRMGRIYYRLRLLMLARELLANRSRTIRLDHGQAIRLPAGLPAQQGADLARALSYANDSRWQFTWPADQYTELKPLAAPQAAGELRAELEALPDAQHLAQVGEFSVYWAMQEQTPKCVLEIARLRERVFRMHNEGSGEPLDTDGFDATYTHLFVWHHATKQIIGAYRMGRTDVLLAQQGLDGLYLHKMFAFDSEFVNRQEPCLELGRSFIIPEFQRSPQGLFMLWRGIGEFINQFPEYRVLYGTVSISKLYTPQSVSIIEHGLVDAPEHVSPRANFPFALHPQLQAFAAQHGLKPVVETFMQSLETDGKVLPVLAKQYQKLGAKFHALGIDKSFNDTPGLLLSVDLRSVPARVLKRYLGKELDSGKAQE
jgi:putative hemolysin